MVMMVVMLMVMVMMMAIMMPFLPPTVLVFDLDMIEQASKRNEMRKWSLI